MNEENLNTSIEDLLTIISQKMPDKTRLYYHCMDGGVIYRNKIDNEYINPLLDWKKHTGSNTLNGDILQGYNITTGMCKYHFNIRMEGAKE